MIKTQSCNGCLIKKCLNSHITKKGSAEKVVQIPEVIALPNLAAGEHTVTFSIPESQPVHKSELNHWLVSAYFVWEL